MTVDRKSTLPPEILETVRTRIAELNEELKAKFDVGFRQGVYITYTVDEAELPDGLWVVFPKTMPAELAYGFMEAGHYVMRTFINSGVIERLKILRQSMRNPPQSHKRK
jgi:hypothetical protein